MSGSSKQAKLKAAVPGGRVSLRRKSNRLKDDVYREMLLLEANRPGAEMGLALALLRAVVQSGSLIDRDDFGEWLRAVCPMGLHMIEDSLAASKCGSPTRRTEENASGSTPLDC